MTAAAFSGYLVIFWQLLVRVYFLRTCFARTLIDSAISVVLTGTVDEAPKLRALCVAEMRKVWEQPINSKGPPFLFWELCKRRYLSCGGALDRHGFLTFQDYVEITGTRHVYFSVFKPWSMCFNTWSTFAGVKGVAWAWEPEITAMAYVLNTTMAVYSRTTKRAGNHWAFYRPGPGQPLSDPMVLLVNLHRFHFEPVQYYNLP